jgi:hypothetical protein
MPQLFPGDAAERGGADVGYTRAESAAEIDANLHAAGWIVQDRQDLDLNARTLGPRVAERTLEEK